jgi:CBS domain-containing protein
MPFAQGDEEAARRAGRREDETMKTLRVRDIMTTEVLTLRASATLEEAVRLMAGARISGAPVKDGEQIVGVVSKSDLCDPGSFQGEGAQRDVGSIMTPVIYAVRPTDPVMSAVRLMALENIHRALVVSEKGELVGIVTPMDILRAMARGERVQDHEGLTEETSHRHADPAVGFVDLRIFERLASEG